MQEDIKSTSYTLGKTRYRLGYAIEGPGLEPRQRKVTILPSATSRRTLLPAQVSIHLVRGFCSGAKAAWNWHWRITSIENKR